MADLSLDEYITKKIPNVQFNKRIGQKVSPGKANLKITTQNMSHNRGSVAPRFKVVGLGNVKVNFDARQKLTRKQTSLQVKDAREKIAQKTRLADARLRIQMKVGTQGPPAKKMGATFQGRKQTVKVRVTNVQPKPVDARQMIKTKQQNRGKNPSQLQRTFHCLEQNVSVEPMATRQSNPKVTITGLGQTSERRGNNQNPIGAAGGSVVRHLGDNMRNLQMMCNNQPQFSYQNVPPMQKNIAVRKTVENVHYVHTPASRVDNNIVISPQDAPVVRRKPAASMQPNFESYTDVSYEDSAIPQYQQYSSMQPDASPIQVRNDAYKQPEPPVVLHQVVSQPVYQQSYYTEPEPSVPVVSTPTPPVRSPLERATRLSHTASTLSMIQSRLGEDPNAVSAVADISPLQGYRVLITNLHHIVTQDDILELFGAVGALKKVRLLRAGTAEVVFVKKDDAVAAIRKYNNRELDGQPMKVVLTSGSTNTGERSTNQPVNPDVSRPQKVSSEPSSETSPVAEVDLNLLHKALFKTTSKDDPPSRPVTFTVKI